MSEFVNRHGHKKEDLNKVDLSDVSIETDGEIQVLEPAEMTKTDTKPMRRKRQFTWGKLQWIITGVAVAILIVVPVVSGEFIAAGYRTGAASVHDKLAAIVKDDVMPAQKQTTIKPSALGDIATKIDNLRSSICAGGLTDNIATLYPRAKSAHDDCIKKAGQLTNLSTAMKRLQSEVQFITDMQNATKAVTAPLSEPFAVTDAQQTNWQDTQAKLDKVHPPVEWQEQHRTLTRYAAAIAQGWSALNTAQNAQDKNGFEEAEKTLDRAYDGFRTTVTQMNGALQETQSSLTTARKALQV